MSYGLEQPRFTFAKQSQTAQCVMALSSLVSLSQNRDKAQCIMALSSFAFAKQIQTGHEICPASFRFRKTESAEGSMSYGLRILVSLSQNHFLFAKPRLTRSNIQKTSNVAS
jgi:hypothetical protein